MIEIFNFRKICCFHSEWAVITKEDGKSRELDAIFNLMDAVDSGV